MKLRLDAKTIADLQLPKGKQELSIWDTDLDGFALRLRKRPDGEISRSYCVMYRAEDEHGVRRQRRKSWDADRLTPAQGREAARKYLAEVELGRDPVAGKAEKRRKSARTFAAMARIYLDAKRSELRPSSFVTARRYLEKPTYFGRLHGMPVTAVTRTDVAECVRDIAARRTPMAAAKARMAVSAFYGWLITEGLLGDAANPVAGTRAMRSVAREHAPTELELVAIWNACASTSAYDRCIRLLILLGNRKTEIGGMRWSELDLKAGTWTLPSCRSKNHRPITVTLPPAALEIIDAVAPQPDRDCLFGTRAERGLTAWGHPKDELDCRLGDVVRPWRHHDLRRSFATGLINLGIEPHIVEACLNHYSGHRAGVAGVYNRSDYGKQIAAALARWADHITGLVEGRQSNVVALSA